MRVKIPAAAVVVPSSPASYGDPVMCCEMKARRMDGSPVTVICIDDGEIERGKPEKGYRSRFVFDRRIVVSDFAGAGGIAGRMAHDDEMLERAGIDVTEADDIVTIDCAAAGAALAAAA